MLVTFACRDGYENLIYRLYKLVKASSSESLCLLLYAGHLELDVSVIYTFYVCSSTDPSGWKSLNL